MAADQPDRDVTTGAQSEALDEARSRRVAMGDAATLVEELIARPASGPEWSARVATALDGLHAAFEEHVREVEGDDGLLPQLTADAPRVANGVKRMYGEHVEIDRMIENAIELIRRCGDRCDETAVESIRLAAGELLRLVSRHRQAGADLVYEAYSVDIGGG